MQLNLESRLMTRAIKQAVRFFESKRVVVCMGDRLALTCFCLSEPIRPVVQGAATTEDEGFEIVSRTKPDLLICSSDLETGYGIDLVKRAKAAINTCQVLIILVRETKAVVDEALSAGADGVMFKSSFGTGKGDFIQALIALAEGQGRYIPEDVRKKVSHVSGQALPHDLSTLTGREVKVVELINEGLMDKEIAAQLSISLQTVKTHVKNARIKLEARNRTHLGALAVRYGFTGD